MSDVQMFVKRILSLEPQATSGYSEYGSRVMPVLEFYAGLREAADQRAFRAALNQMLVDPAERVRDFAVTICIGFIILYDAI